MEEGQTVEGSASYGAPWMDLDGHRVHYVDRGSGPVLLFVHAGPAWSFVFNALIARLSPDFRCVALDFPGSGPSEAAPGYAPSVAGAAKLLEEFVERLSLGSFVLVANDVGGPVALGGLGRAHPERVQGIVVAESFGWPLSGNPKVLRMLRLMGSPPMIALNAATNFLARMTSTRFGVGRHLDSAGRAQFLEPYRSRSVRRNALAMLASVADAEPYLEQVRSTLKDRLSGKPVLTVFGDKSPATKEGFVDHWAQMFPAARHLVVPGAHHFPQMDEPELVADRIRAWWREEVAPAGHRLEV